MIDNGHGQRDLNVSEGTDKTKEDIENFKEDLKLNFFLLVNCLRSRNSGICWDVNLDKLEECTSELLKNRFYTKNVKR